MWTVVAQVISAVVSVFSLGWIIIVQVRTTSGRKHAERAETAARLLAVLQDIGIGGSSSRLADSYARELHDAQIHRLHEVIRVNTAEFERRAKRSGFSLMFHSLVGAYGIVAMMASVGIGGGLEKIRPDQRWLGELFVVAFFILGVIMVLDFVLAVRRRLISRSVHRRAGLYVPSALEVISTHYVGFHQRRQRKRARQAQSNTTDGEACDQPDPSKPHGK